MTVFNLLALMALIAEVVFFALSHVKWLPRVVAADLAQASVAAGALGFGLILGHFVPIVAGSEPEYAVPLRGVVALVGERRALGASILIGASVLFLVFVLVEILASIYRHAKRPPKR